MINLPFSCHCTELNVYPNNWTSKNASLKKSWYVYYRFHDPNFRDNPKFKTGKLVIIKRMNQFKTVSERQENTKLIIEQELDKLRNKAYNPITKKKGEVILSQSEIEPSCPFISALILAEKRISASPSSKRDLKSVLRFVKEAAIQLGYIEMPISMVSRKHLKQLLAHIDLVKGESAHRYNKIRSYLMIIYNELIELEVIEANPLKDLSKKKSIQKIRKLPSEEDRQLISEYLYKHQYRFWLFMQIFFHSGARITELMKIIRRDINLREQFFIITIKKGRIAKEVIRPIKNIALPFWEEAIESASNDDYIFSKELLPGQKAIQSYQITKRWNRHIKAKLGIKADFYSLKHLNLDQTAAILGINDASAMASHASTGVTIKHYAFGEKLRQNERLRKVENKFA